MKTAKHKVCVIGDGGWGTALALLLANNGMDVAVWGPFPDYIEEIRANGENKLYLPGIKLDPRINWTNDRRSAADGAGIAVLAVPTAFFRQTVGSFRGILAPNTMLVSVAKGIDSLAQQRMSEVAAEVTGINSVAALSGPSHAEEVARKIPTAVTIASAQDGLSGALQAVFSNPFFRVYTSTDIIGVETGGALKNIIAIAVGVSGGLGFGDNTSAALITRGLAEIARLGVALGGRPATFAGLSGMGDLIVTCTSRHSRNRSVGEQIGRGRPVQDILSGMKQVAEGVPNCRTARELAARHKIDVPITEEVCRIVHEGKDPRDAVSSLLARDLRAE